MKNSASASNGTNDVEKEIKLGARRVDNLDSGNVTRVRSSGTL